MPEVLHHVDDCCIVDFMKKVFYLHFLGRAFLPTNAELTVSLEVGLNKHQCLVYIKCKIKG